MQEPWLKSYPEGVPAEVPPPGFRSLRDMIEQSFRDHADRPAFTNMGRTLSYRDLDRLSMAFACYLQKHLGLVRGERVAVMLPNLLQYPVALCGIFRAGLVAVNVNPLYTARELEHQLRDSGARCIVILETLASTLEAVIAGTAVEHVITSRVGELLGFPRGVLTDFVVRYVRRAAPRYALPDSVRFSRALEMGRQQTLSAVDLGFADIAFLQYTGGTTGRSKGAMLSHRNMVSNVAQTQAWTGGIFDDIDRVVAITALPLYHVFSLTSNCLLMMAIGGENVLITDPRNVAAFVREMRRHRFSYITGVNTMFAALLNDPGFPRIDFRALRLTIGGGMAVQEAVARQWQDVTGRPIVQAYGLTETSPAATINPLDSTAFTGSAGLPICSTAVRICDDAGKDMPAGEPGEICIRGPQVMEGYWKNPDETAAVMLPGGWFRTGDIGRMDDAGFLYIEDRKKDMILVSGFNVYPNELEDVVVGMDGVLEAAAIGVPDDRSGEAVKLFVVKSDPAITADDVMAYCREYLTRYKLPREIEFRDELPKTGVGKILRRALRDA